MLTSLSRIAIVAILACTTLAAQADELTPGKRAQIKALLEITGVKAIPDQIASNTVQSWHRESSSSIPSFRTRDSPSRAMRLRRRLVQKSTRRVV